MASIFKLPGQKHDRTKPWWFDFTNEFGKRQRKKGFKDKRLTKELAVKIEDEVRRKTSGLVSHTEQRRADAAEAPLSVHVDAFEKHLNSKRNTGKHIKLTLSRIRSVIDAGAFATLADFTGESVAEVLQEFQQEQELGHRTYNHYVQALDGFGRWLDKTDRVLSNPMKALPRLNSAEDVRHKRRALSATDMAALIASAQNSTKKVQGYSGTLRARLYRLAYLTGLRRRELGSLTGASFKLNGGTTPTLTVQAACSKHRKRDTLPVHPELLELLREWLPSLAAGAFLFPNLERKKTWQMVKTDLEAAGIAYETEEGIADFHAAGRHSYISGLISSGVSLSLTQKLARHGDVRMTTMYTHIGLADQAEALAVLPAPSVPEPGQHSSQHICSADGPPTGDAMSRPGIPSHTTPSSACDTTPKQSGTFDAGWQNEVGDGDSCHHPPKSGGGGNRNRHFSFAWKTNRSRMCVRRDSDERSAILTLLSTLEPIDFNASRLTKEISRPSFSLRVLLS